MCSKTLKNGFSNRAYGIMVSPLFSFRLFFVSGGTITNDLSTARNRSIIWRHCLCIGNGSGNIARNTNTGIGLMYIYVIFLTMPAYSKKKDDYERNKTHFLTLLCVGCCFVVYGSKFITEISLMHKSVIGWNPFWSSNILICIKLCFHDIVSWS